MLHKSFTALICLLIYSGCMNEIFSQTEINFSFNDGSDNSYALEDVRKLDFNGDEMNLHLIDGSIFTWNVNTIGYYDYNSNNSSDIDDILHKINAWDVNVFPNPSVGNQTLSIKLPKGSELLVTIMDISGKIIIQQNLGMLPKGKHSIPLEWSNAPAGSYSIVLNSKDFSVSKKLIKK
jgi:hypothetical protein